MLAGLKTPAEEYIANSNEFPPTVESIGAKTSGKYTADIVSNPYDYYFQATMNDNAGERIAGKTVRLTFDPNSYTWTCSPGTPNGLPNNFLPSNCKE